MALAEALAEPISASLPETGGTLTIDLAAIEANWRTLARQTRAAECAAVVKANAYGLGVEAVTTKLNGAGCKTFFVADLAEARRVRACARDAVIYVLGGFSPEIGSGYIDVGARPVINSTTELAEWDAFAAARNWRGGAAIHVDTGMNRLGMGSDEAAALAPRVQTENHGITLLMSHMACAEIPHHSLNAVQMRLFKELRGLFRGVPASLANSSAIFLSDSTHWELARPGAALYGVNPTPGRANPMQSVVALTSRILQIRTVERGRTVGYGAAWAAKRPTRLAVAAAGYADGLMRASSGINEARGVASIAGKLCPFVGRISMDLVCIDVTDLPDGSVRRGDLATFIGEGTLIDDVAARAGTIGYEILTQLGRRCHIVYSGI
jgi:alanine racemase